MEVAITAEEEKPLLSRKEISAKVSFDGATPSAKDVQELLAKQLKADASLVVVKQIASKYGLQEAGVLAYQYMSEEEKKRIEPSPKEKKEKPKESGEAPAEKPKKEEKAEAPAEKKEAKPEKPTEEKPKEAPKEEAK